MAPSTKCRKTWVPLVKIAASSLLDLSGDWKFYKAIGGMDPRIVDKYEGPAYTVFFLGCIMNVLLLFTLLCRGFAPKDRGLEGPFELCMQHLYKRVSQLLILDIILEDVPEIILTALVKHDKGKLTPALIYNAATCLVHFVVSISDILAPDDEDEDEDEDDKTAAEATDPERQRLIETASA